MTIVRIEGHVLDHAPAVFDPEWLPPVDLWPALSEQRAEVARLYAIRGEAWAAHGEVKARMDALGAERHAAMEESIRSGGDGVVTAHDAGIESLRVEVEAAEERAQVAVRLWHDAINDAVALVVESREAWLADLDDHDARVEMEIAELQRQLRDATARRGQTDRLRHWVDRTGGEAAEQPGMHIQYSAVPTAAPPAPGPGEDSSAHDEWIRNHQAANYGGPKAVRVSDEAKEALEADEDVPLEVEAAELRAEYASGAKQKSFEQLGGKI